MDLWLTGGHFQHFAGSMFKNCHRSPNSQAFYFQCKKTGKFPRESFLKKHKVPPNSSFSQLKIFIHCRDQVVSSIFVFFSFHSNSYLSYRVKKIDEFISNIKSGLSPIKRKKKRGRKPVNRKITV